EGGRVQHLLHARATGGTLVAHNQHLAGLDGLVEDDGDRLFMALNHAGGAGEGPQFLVDTGGLDHRSVGGDVAAQHHQTTIGGVGVLDAVDAAVLGIGVQGIPAVVGGERLGGTDATGGGVEEV